MSQTLYRKYRSQRFSELVGQKQVTQILKNAITRDRLSHAYLFCGPRGTGKTSVARIFAKALNCLDPKDGDCCGVCENCTSITSGNAVDVIEIDAASKNKVDDVRDLRDKVSYAPLRFGYKIYIIDEVHMITTQGFNALLKTLEEPPSFIKFLLCTTEPHKLPITILSRCTRFDFQRLPLDELAEHLVWMAKQEGFVLEAGASDKLAELAEGSARDAISLLDQLTVYCEDVINEEAIRELFQLGDPGLAGRVADLIAGHEPAELLQVWQDLASQGADAGRFLLKLGDELKQRYIETRDRKWERALHAIWQGVNMLKFEGFPALLVELTLIKAQQSANMANQQVAVQASHQQVRTSVQQPTAVSGKPVQRPAVSLAPKPSTTGAGVNPIEKKDPVGSPQTVAQSQVTTRETIRHVGSSSGADGTWDGFLSELEKRRLTTYGIVSRSSTGTYSNGILTMSFDTTQHPANKQTYKYLQSDDHRSYLLDAAKAVFGPQVQVELMLVGNQQDKVLLTQETAKVEKKPEELPREIVADVHEETEVDKRSRIDPEAMVKDALSMPVELDSHTGTDEERHPTIGETITLFGGTEIVDEEEA